MNMSIDKHKPVKTIPSKNLLKIVNEVDPQELKDALVHLTCDDLTVEQRNFVEKLLVKVVEVKLHRALQQDEPDQEPPF